MRRGRRGNDVSGTLKIEWAESGCEVTEAQRESVAQRVLLALSRFGAGVARVTVRLSDVANPLGGVDTRCEMRAWLRPSGSVAVETVDGAGAIDRAAVRLAARVEWALVDGGGEVTALATPVALALASDELRAEPSGGRPMVARARRRRRA